MMIKKTILISSACYLSTKDAQMHLHFPNPEDNKPNTTICIEDIGLLVIDHYQVTMSQGLINRLLSNKSAVIWCDEKHMPQGVLSPLTGNHVFAEKLRSQLNASEPLKKNLWKQTIQRKIENQITVLAYWEKDISKISALVDKVKSGDPENVEGHASHIYWNQLLSPFETKRGRFEASPNNYFNYGYAILRSIVARSLVISGCLPALGIHHRNKYNPFALADDIMEPFRPYVDLWVLNYLYEELDGEPREDLNKEDKAHLLKIPVLDIDIEGKNYPLMVGMQRITASLMQCFEGTNRKIPYPKLKDTI